MIYAKLLDFQRKQITMRKSGTNPYFSSRYVPLNEVLDTAIPVLNEMGVVAVQTPQDEGLHTVLYDTEDGSSVEGYMPYADRSTSQALGGSNTYNRRYSLITMLGLGDQDDDGNEAHTAPMRYDVPATAKARNEGAATPPRKGGSSIYISGLADKVSAGGKEYSVATSTDGTGYTVWDMDDRRVIRSKVEIDGISEFTGTVKTSEKGGRTYHNLEQVTVVQPDGSDTPF